MKNTNYIFKRFLSDSSKEGFFIKLVHQNEVSIHNYVYYCTNTGLTCSMSKNTHNIHNKTKNYLSRFKAQQLWVASTTSTWLVQLIEYLEMKVEKWCCSQISTLGGIIVNKVKGLLLGDTVHMRHLQNIGQGNPKVSACSKFEKVTLFRNFTP